MYLKSIRTSVSVRVCAPHVHTFISRQDVLSRIRQLIITPRTKSLRMASAHCLCLPSPIPVAGSLPARPGPWRDARHMSEAMDECVLLIDRVGSVCVCVAIEPGLHRFVPLHHRVAAGTTRPQPSALQPPRVHHTCSRVGIVTTFVCARIQKNAQRHALDARIYIYYIKYIINICIWIYIYVYMYP